MANQQAATPRVQETKGDGNSETSERALAAITVSSRIPEFWADQTRLWFVQFEAAVENQRLSDAAKQNLVVTKLSKNAIQQVSDLLLSPPESNKYDSLKARLLEVFEESETRKLQKLIGEMDLGDQRPSQLLRRMRALAREKVPDDTLRLMWQSHLPTAVRAVLTVSDSKNLDILANMADKVLESTGAGSVMVSEVSAVQTVSKAEAGTSDTSRILGELAKINLRLKDLERGRGTDRYDNRQRSRSASRSGNANGKRKSNNWLCFYHYRYRENATKCVQPCNWKGTPVTSSEN